MGRRKICRWQPAVLLIMFSFNEEKIKFLLPNFYTQALLYYVECAQKVT